MCVVRLAKCPGVGLTGCETFGVDALRRGVKVTSISE